jgi:hypothetical protein
VVKTNVRHNSNYWILGFCSLYGIIKTLENTAFQKQPVSRMLNSLVFRILDEGQCPKSQ